MTNKKSSLWILCCALLTPAVQAADINLRGFASFVGGIGSSDEVETLGYLDEFDFSNDSLIALQADADLGDGLSATMQVLSRGNNGYDAKVEWAYFTYEFSDSMQLSGGKIRIPFYRYSDFIDVGYAYNWLAVPDTVYGFNLPSYDGLSFLSDYTLGDWDFSWQLIYGEVEGDFDDDGTRGKIEGLTGASLKVVRDWLTLRVGYMQSTVSINIPQFDQIYAGLDAMGAGDQRTYIEVDDDKGSFMGAALGIDFNNIIFDVEFITYTIDDSFLPSADAYYITAGYRLNKFVPTLTYSELTSELEANFTSTGVPQIDIGLQMLADGYAAQAEEETELVDLALRYDFHHSAALKYSISQLSRKNLDDETVFRVGIDLIF